MMREAARTVALLSFCLMLVLPARADDDPSPTPASLRAALLYGSSVPPVLEPPSGSNRSIPLAFGLSALVPGAGQAYNRQWLKAAVALGTEAALISGYTIWHSQGVEGRDDYQAYAHAYWSPVRYAGWLNDYADWLTERGFIGPETPEIVVPDALLDSGFDVTNPEGWTIDQQIGINRLISQIRAMEDDVVHPETGASFSHKLPQFAEQQYYELIGKYFQFAPGWSDYPDWMTNGTFNDATIDPERTVNGEKVNVSDRFFQYADDHGHANALLRRASRMSAFFVLNHLVAAVDAAVFAKLHNDRLEPMLSLAFDEGGSIQPKATLRVKL